LLASRQQGKSNYWVTIGRKITKTSNQWQETKTQATCKNNNHPAAISKQKQQSTFKNNKCPVAKTTNSNQPG